MKNLLCIIPAILLYFSLHSMNCIKRKKKLPKYNYKTVANDIFQNYIYKLFLVFYYDYYPNYRGSFQNYAIALSKKIKKHKKDQLRLIDISNVLECYTYRRYSHEYGNAETLVSDEENIFFLETMLPVLFENYNFPSLFKDRSFAKQQLRFLPLGGINPYIASYYLYYFNFPIKRLEKQSPLLCIAQRAALHRVLRAEDGTLITDFNTLVSRTLQDMITPPNSWIQKEKKELLKPVKTLLLSLKRHSTKNSAYKISKPIKAMILFHTIPDSKAAQQYKKIRDDLLDELQHCQEDHEIFCHSDCICCINLYPWNFKMCDPVPTLLEQFSHDLNIKF